MNKIVKRTLKIFGGIIVGILSLLGVLLIAIVIYTYPVLDRMYIRPCYYYPHAFSDCQ